MMLGRFVYSGLFFGIPLVVLLLFIISLYMYLAAKRRNKEAPGSVPEDTLKNRKIFLIITSVITGVLLAMVIGIMIILYMAVAFM